MVRKRSGPMLTDQGGSTPLQAPNAGELDVYSVLWAERLGEDRPLRLSEVHERVKERRRGFGEPEPALTTISTHLRALVHKGLAEETLAGVARPGPGPRVRGGLTPPTRSPRTPGTERCTPRVTSCERRTLAWRRRIPTSWRR